MMKNRRRPRLVKPELQTQAIFVSLAFAVATVALTCASSWYFMRESIALHEGLDVELPKALRSASAVTLAVLAPVLLVYVTYATHRVAGPAFRMEQYLKAYLRGEDPGRLTPREKDELHILANLIDMALAKKEGRSFVAYSHEMSLGDGLDPAEIEDDSESRGSDPAPQRRTG